MDGEGDGSLGWVWGVCGGYDEGELGRGFG